jgi:hypothetical protein
MALAGGGRRKNREGVIVWQMDGRQLAEPGSAGSVVDLWPRCSVMLGLMTVTPRGSRTSASEIHRPTKPARLAVEVGNVHSSAVKMQRIGAASRGGGEQRVLGQVISAAMIGWPAILAWRIWAVTTGHPSFSSPAQGASWGFMRERGRQ